MKTPLSSLAAMAAVTGPLLASALPLAAPEPRSSFQPYTLIAAHSASPIHLQSIEAANGNFWIGKAATTYCPPSEEAAGNCTQGANTTVFTYIGSHGTETLATKGPNQQQVFVQANGALSYTAKLPTDFPEGSARTGFSLLPGDSFGTFSFEKGFVACPTAGTFPYQIFAAVDGQNFDTCIGLDALTSAVDGPSAWQYLN
ncbi:MAG: hypothetical protein M1812_006135 [Candelaria pacifica]|nr:MAG: hypothetical protein M1812_006135 [Candelaria pacifica]